ncbi:MAG: Hsp20/alpha crystallin family protein [Cyanobacteria bacterium P01_D01_bin.73]
MAVNNNNSDFSGDRFNSFNENSDNNNSAEYTANNAANNAADNASGPDGWAQAFNREVAQRQASAMMEQVMAMAGKIQEQMQAQMQAQMQQMQDGGTPQGFGFPGAAPAPQGDVLRDSETAIIVSLTLPGLKEESVNVEVKDQLLRVTGAVDASAILPPGFPAPPALGFTRMLALPVAVHGDRPTVTTTESTLSIILPKVEPGTLTDDQLRQMAAPPMAANPMASILEAMMQGMPGMQPPRRRTLGDRLAQWQKAATENLNRWSKTTQARAGQAFDQVSEKVSEQMAAEDRPDFNAMFETQSRRHAQLMQGWTKTWNQGRQWMGQQLKSLGDRLSK